MLKKMVLAILLLASFNASADSFHIAAKANPGQSCAWFSGGFTKNGYMRPMNEGRPVIACKLVEGVGATCVVNNHGIAGLPSPMALSGDFGDIENTLVIHSHCGPVNVKLYCDAAQGCYLFQMYDSDDRIGYACDMSNWKAEAPKPKPAPKAPPLLRKPDDSNKPVPQKSDPFSV